MTMPAYDPLSAAWNWLVSLAGILTDPSSPFWWPSIAVAVIGFGLAAWATGTRLRDARREALPRATPRFWRQVPEDLALMLANSAIPFLAAPVLFLLGAGGATVGYLLALPVFGEPDFEAQLDHPAAMALAAFVAFLFGDFALYWSHRLFHRFPRLWRTHAMHHAPEFLTPLTAFRFWPHEQIVHIACSTMMGGLGLGIVTTMLGAKVTPMTLLGVNAFYLVWNLAFAHLRHSHVALPFPRWLCFVLVSPHMHQVHHSVEARHHDRNFATVFAFWDWMFGTLYIPDPKERFRFGIEDTVADGLAPGAQQRRPALPAG
jgi:sterol desaturase/sphingolipid hydroxylase (fatty acid hydroxylase superfamily)